MTSNIVPASPPATTATGYVTLFGAVATQQNCDDWEYNESGFLYCADYITTYDSGAVNITVGGYTASYSYWQGDTVDTILAGLASTFNAATASPVTATVTANQINLTAKVAGSVGNYNLSAGATSDNGWGSFSTQASGSTLTGGSDGTPYQPVEGGGPDITFNSKNQIIGYVYDNNGNLAADGHHTYSYDAENRLVSVDNGAEFYVYDGLGERVKKTPQNSLRMVYGPGGKIIAEYDATTNALLKEYLYGVNVMVTADGTGSGLSYITADHLGTPRVITDVEGNLVSRHDAMPFGEEISRPGVNGFGIADGLREKFTGYERDDETGLDFAQARYHSSQQGRFTSPDPLLSSARPGIPQSWNRYSYVINNPLALTDSSGLDWWYVTERMIKHPFWSDADPQGKTARWSSFRDYVYHDDETGHWWALDPYSNRSARFDDEASATAKEMEYLGDPPLEIGVSLTQADLDRFGGVAEMLNPIPFAQELENQALGVDLTSREHTEGVLIGAVLTGGVGGIGHVASSLGGGGFKLALGLASDRQAFNAFAESKGALTIPPGAFIPENFQAAANGADSIHFNLDKFDFHNFGRWAKQNGVRDFFTTRAESHITNWELYQILTNKSLLNKTTFYNIP